MASFTIESILGRQHREKDEITDCQTKRLHPHCYNSLRVAAFTEKRNSDDTKFCWRKTFTKEQRLNLEETFQTEKYLSVRQRRLLATNLRLSNKQVKTWFQNRRTKWKKELQSYHSPPPKTSIGAPQRSTSCAVGREPLYAREHFGNETLRKNGLLREQCFNFSRRIVPFTCRHEKKQYQLTSNCRDLTELQDFQGLSEEYREEIKFRNLCVSGNPIRYQVNDIIQCCSRQNSSRDANCRHPEKCNFIIHNGSCHSIKRTKEYRRMMHNIEHENSFT